MKTQVIMNSQVHESRIAILEDSKLVELLIERPDQKRMVGNIYKGKVERVLPGIQAAFVDIGMEKRAFLHVSDVARYDPFADSETDDYGDNNRNYKKGGNIKYWVKQDEEILVQITKEPIGTKGPRCTTEITLAGRYIVFMPGQKRLGVSRKIRSRKERNRIRKVMRGIIPDGIGLIGRSAAEDKSDKVLEKDLNFLLKDWEEIKKKADVLDSPAMLYKDMGMAPAIVRDLFTADMDEFILDSKSEYERIRKYAGIVVSKLVNRIKLHKSEIPIFDAYDIEPQIENMLKRKIWLKGGAYIVIDNTEALISIDINSGRNIGRGKSYEDTLLQINKRAATEISRQLRLRDLGGIIAIDFIDMEEEKNRRALMDCFKAAMCDDRARYRILNINDFGIVMLTRQRVRQSVIQSISDPCPVCAGLGRVFSPVTVIGKIERWLMRASKSRRKNFLLVVHPSVAEELQTDNNQRLHELEMSAKVRIECFADPTVYPDDYSVLDADSGEDITEEFE